MPRTTTTAPVRHGIASMLFLALFASLLVAVASPAAAAGELTFTHWLHDDRVEVDFFHPDYPADLPPLVDIPVGAMAGQLDGSPVIFYCLDAVRPLPFGTVGPESTWAATGSPNLATVASILVAYDALDSSGDPVGYALSGTAQERAASIQAAVWFYTNGATATSPATIVSNVSTIVDAVDDGVLPLVLADAPSLSITGSPASGLVDTSVGPFQVVTNAPSVDLSATSGQIVDMSTGTPLANPVAAGTEFGVRSATPGDVTISASMGGLYAPSRVFVSDGLQPVMLVEPVPAALSAAATASILSPPPPTPPSSPPSSTTTTSTPAVVSDDTSTSTTTSTTAASGALSGRAAATQAVSAQATSAQALPNTGSSTGLMVTISVAFLVIGFGLYVTGRRRLVTTPEP